MSRVKRKLTYLGYAVLLESNVSSAGRDRDLEVISDGGHGHLLERGERQGGRIGTSEVALEPRAAWAVGEERRIRPGGRGISL